MKNSFYVLILTLSVFLSSCGGVKVYDNKESILSLEEVFNSKFGDNSYYTDVSITNPENSASIIGVTQTDDPASLEMGGWNYLNGTWEQHTEISLEIPEGVQAEEYMFQLGKEVTFDMMAKLVEEAKAKVINEKEIEEVRVEMVSVKAPDDGDFDSMRYFIVVTPKQGGTDFNFWFKMDGTLDSFDY